MFSNNLKRSIRTVLVALAIAEFMALGFAGILSIIASDPIPFLSYAFGLSLLFLFGGLLAGLGIAWDKWQR